GDSLDACRCAEPRAVADADELRRRPPDSPQPWLVGLLRPRLAEPEPPGPRCDVPLRLPDSRNAELAIGLSARRLRGGVSRYATHGHRAADREHPQRCDSDSSPARTA